MGGSRETGRRACEWECVKNIRRPTLAVEARPINASRGRSKNMPGGWRCLRKTGVDHENGKNAKRARGGGGRGGERRSRSGWTNDPPSMRSLVRLAFRSCDVDGWSGSRSPLRHNHRVQVIRREGETKPKRATAHCPTVCLPAAIVGDRCRRSRTRIRYAPLPLLLEGSFWPSGPSTVSPVEKRNEV